MKRSTCSRAALRDGSIAYTFRGSEYGMCAHRHIACLRGFSEAQIDAKTRKMFDAGNRGEEVAKSEAEAIQAYCSTQCRRRVAATVADCEHRKCQLWEFRGNGQTPAQQGFSVGEWVHIESWGGSSFGSFNDKDLSRPDDGLQAC